jgi:uncharacterized membrane protein
VNLISEITGGAKETGRIEAFSDGVFAIAITLLVLDLRVPRELPDGADLTEALLSQWPSYLAFVTSFATILIMWVNHHRLFTLIRRADHGLLLVNGLLLLGITVVPFPTSLLAEYINRPGQHAAAIVYTSVSVFIALFFNALWWYVSYKNRLLDPHADPSAVRGISRSYAFGPALYLLAFALTFVNVTASLLLVLALDLYFALPNRRLGALGRRAS